MAADRASDHEIGINDIHQLRALAHPTRQGILSVLSLDPKTNKQLADALGQSQQRVYHHVKTLEAAGLIAVEEVKESHGHLEKYYSLVADSFRVHGSLAGMAESENVALAAVGEMQRTLLAFRPRGRSSNYLRVLHKKVALSNAEVAKLEKLIVQVQHIIDKRVNTASNRPDLTVVDILLVLHGDGPEQDC